MNKLALSIFTSLIVGPASMACAQGNWVVWSQPQNTSYAIVPSFVAADPLGDIEVADDFEVHGTIERIVASGYDCFNCAMPDVIGVRVRFYEWTAEGPGALVSESFVADGTPGLTYSALYPATLDITLASPFKSNGRHFLSIQLELAGSGSWYWWITNHESAQGVIAMTRNRLDGPDAPWTGLEAGLGPLNSDVSFLLWGQDDNPPPPGTDPCGTWSVTPTPNPGVTDHAILRDAAAISAPDVWAVGESTAMVQGVSQTFTMALHWDGSAWSVIPSPSPTACPVCTYATFDAVAAAGPDDVWAAGGNRVQAPDGFLGTQLLVARHDGKSWTVMDTPLTIGGSGANVRDIEIISPTDIWFFGDWINPQGGSGNWPALAMHWNGSTFTIVPTPFPSGGTPGWATEAGSALSATDIWAVGGGSDGDEVASGYIIHWDGSAWTRVQGPTPGAFQRLYDVKAIAPDDAWAVGDYLDVNLGYMPLFIHWDGTSWTQVASPGGGRSLAVFGPDNIYSGGAGIVHWNGVDWQQVEEFNSVIGPSVASISAVGLCDIWAVGRQIVAGDILNFSAHLESGAVGDFEFLGDVNGDFTVNIDDLLAVINAWGACPGKPAACPADVVPDATVNIDDLLLVINHWG